MPEYEQKEKHPDWYWALLVIVVAGSATALIYDNFFFAILLILGGVLMWYFGRKAPELINHELNDEGLVLRTRLFPYEDLKSFFVSINPKPTLFVRSSRVFMPIISMPIEPNQAQEIKDAMLQKEVPEEEMKEHVSGHIMDMLGF